MEILGIPSNQFLDVNTNFKIIQMCPRKKIFFDQGYKPKLEPNANGKIRHPGSKSLNYYLKCSDNNFLNFV